MSYATYGGIGIGTKLALARVARFDRAYQRDQVREGASEIGMAFDAMEAAAERLESLANSTIAPASEILLAQSLMARDPAFRDAVAKEIDAGAEAGAAIVKSADGFASQLRDLGGYFAERSSDVLDVAHLALRLLQGVEPGVLPVRELPYVLVAKTLSPADTVNLDSTQVAALVTEQGGRTSHTSVIARSLGIPAVVGCAEARLLEDGEMVLVDPVAGEVVRQPDEYELIRRNAANRLRQKRKRVREDLVSSGRVELLVNAGAFDELAVIAAAESSGIGLLRTELIFMDRLEAPSVEEQIAVYAEVFAAFSGRKVVVRTLDSGADKPLAFLRRDKEPNPALGIRGLRTSSFAPKILEDQLQALSAASQNARCEVWVMAPMVATPREAREFVSHYHKYPVDKVGVMVEIPALALAAKRVIDEVDFASVGTNDLAQYAFAADREVSEFAELLDPWQPELLKLLGMVGEAGKAAGKPVGVCGEAASDPGLAVILAGLGATSLSMSSSALPEVREVLSSVKIRDARRAAKVAVSSASASEAKQAALKSLGWTE